MALVGVALVAAVLVGAWWTRSSRGGESEACAPGEPEQLSVEVIDEIPHDPQAFTQGLTFDAEGRLFESTGLEGRSSVRRLDPGTGEVLDRAELPADLFGEGLAVSPDGELVQLTWTEEQALQWSPEPLERRGGFTYEGEGWGLAELGDGTYAMSDGSDEVTIRRAEDFAALERVRIARSGGEVGPLNELEWDGERLWANRWQTDEILRIDLDCARVDGVLDATELRRRAEELAGDARSIDVLNGIAAIGEEGGSAGAASMLVTGKLWPVMFAVQVTPG